MEPLNYFPKYRFLSAILCFGSAYLTSKGHPFWFSVFFGTGIAQLIYAYYRSLTIDSARRAVVITGCDTGFGHSLAKNLHAIGFTVFACCLNKNSDGAFELKKVGKTSNRLHVIQLDVTSQKDVDEARQYVESRLPEHGLWAVVNNAGIAGSSSYVEWTKIEEYDKVTSVNLIGVIRVTKAFLPLIRKECGRIVNMSSLLGLAVEQYSSSYSITKFGIEAFSDVLRLEMNQFNVKVCIIEPGNFVSATSIIAGQNSLQLLGRQCWEELDETLKKDYGNARFEKMLGLAKILAKFSAKDNGVVVDAMADAVYRVYPKDRYQPFLLHDKVMAFVGYFFPSFFSDFLKITLLKFIYFMYKD